MNPMINTPRFDLTPLKCPRCHRHIVYVDRSRPKIYAVRCASCGFIGPEDKKIQKATLKWNKIAR